jgi:hypothetical protein
MEKAVLPFAYCIGDVLHLTSKVDVVNQRREGVTFQMRGGRLVIKCAGALESLFQHLSIGIKIFAGVVVGIYTGGLPCAALRTRGFFRCPAYHQNQ